MSTRRLRLPLGAAMLIAVAGCHTYTPTPMPALGSTVRVHVPVSNALANRNQAAQTAAIEGTLIERGDTIALAVTRRQEYGAYREIIQYDTVRLGRDQPSLLEVREFSPQKSVLLGAVITAGATVAAIAAFRAGQDGGDVPTPGEGEPPAASIVVTPSIVSAILGLFGGG